MNRVVQHASRTLNLLATDPSARLRTSLSPSPLRVYNECRKRPTNVRPKPKWGGVLRNVALIALLAWIVLPQFTLNATIVQAQQPELSIAEMRVSLWPEYDDPRLLVIYRGRFEDSVTFPRAVTFAIPLDAQVNAAAYAGDTGELFTTAWQARQEDGFQLIKLDLPVPAFQLEFYHDAIQGSTDKHFAFTFQAPYAVESLRFDVQQPLKASDLQMDPPPTETVVDAMGFQYAVYDLGAVSQDQTVEIQGSYVKAGAGTSVPPRRPSESMSTPAETSALVEGSSRWALLLGAAALLFGTAIAAGILWTRRAPLPRLRRAGPPERATVPAAFCTQCGTRLGQEDHFCRQCGAPVKSPQNSARRQRRRSRKPRQT